MNINLFKRNQNQVTATKRQFLKALRRRDAAAIQGLTMRSQNLIGESKLTQIVDEALRECDAESHSWFFTNFLGQFRYQQMQQAAQNNVFHLLVTAGLEPGKDFSFGLDGEMIVSDRAKQILLDHLPHEQRKLFAAQLQVSAVADPIVAIEQQLGCPFYQNLTKIAADKLKQLNNKQAAAYLGVLLAGLVKRHPALQDVDFPTKFILNTLQGLPQQRATAILNDPETDPQFDEVIIFQDLLAAMAEPETSETENCNSLEQLKKLDRVWCGEYRLAEIVASLEELSRE
ncbi:hypothetical protein H6G74_25855 [Nostoc spongiaeforme FACHB-130]|uniref:Uncharacterized protein n=1 Tax=Nostoc spongiaeforme FACHB-130 TaxID=1357510 RepID=A0ABR8G3B6_9NOSO|nr:hypothetical protein [Nostoc spongiaeforme]MBD2597722.1 hypothetical protein [Nostoc spongiaeforme FACHB-130]